MNEFSVCENKLKVSLSDIDFTKKLKLSSLFSYFQDIASTHAGRIGYGVIELEKDYGVTWVLLRIKVEILRNPEWLEDITIETWPQLPKKIEFDRDFIIRDSKDNIIIKAISTWLLLDIKTREIRKSEIVRVNYSPVKTERAFDYKLGKIKAFDKLDFVYKKVIGYSDVDLNGHLNNTKYLDYIMDCFPLESHKHYAVKSIEVNYINEAFPGDTIILSKDISALNENNIYIEGVNEKDNKVVFRSLVEIQKK